MIEKKRKRKKGTHLGSSLLKDGINEEKKVGLGNLIVPRRMPYVISITE